MWIKSTHRHLVPQANPRFGIRRALGTQAVDRIQDRAAAGIVRGLDRHEVRAGGDADVFAGVRVVGGPPGVVGGAVVPGDVPGPPAVVGGVPIATSGVGRARTMAAYLETHRRPDGSVAIVDVLRAGGNALDAAGIQIPFPHMQLFLEQTPAVTRNLTVDLGDASSVAAGIDWWQQMTDAGGGFYSTQDADSEGHEGKFFVWDINEIRSALGETAAALFADYYNVSEQGNFEGKNILNVTRTVEDVAVANRVTVDELQESLAQKGYMSRDAIATGPGVFGPRTERAVKQFQAQNRIKVTGVVGVLRGAVMVMADLARAFNRHVEMDWMAVSSYGSGTTSSGVVRILKDLDTDISGRDVLIVDEIIDTGLTLSWLTSNLGSRGPASVEICTLLRKPEALRMDVDVKYVGWDIPNEFVVGYGLDYREKYRNLRDIGTLAPHIYS